MSVSGLGSNTECLGRFYFWKGSLQEDSIDFCGVQEQSGLSGTDDFHKLPHGHPSVRCEQNYQYFSEEDGCLQHDQLLQKTTSPHCRL